MSEVMKMAIDDGSTNVKVSWIENKVLKTIISPNSFRKDWKSAALRKDKKIYNYVAGAAAGEDFEPIDLVAVLKELNASFGIPASLSEAGVTKDKFDAMADDAMKSGNIAVNPRATKKSDVLDLYEKAF